MGRPRTFHQALALPLPIQVICELLGVPYADRDQFRAWSEAVGDVRDRVRSEQELGELFGYGQQLVARKRKQRTAGGFLRISEGWEFESLRARQRVGSPFWFIIQAVQCH